MERPLLPENLLQVTFDDAAIYFSEEQWRNLEDFQKKIYKELIKEIYETMLALGYRIPKPEIVCRIERGEEPCIDSSRRSKVEEPQAEGSKDARPVIKVERESPEASVPLHPSEISSSQERGGAMCPRCGMCCNNQCGGGYQWGAQVMYPGTAMDGGHRKPYVTPSPTYYNGNPVSPGYPNRGDRMPHPTSPMGYGNVGMVPLSPHYPGYRNVGDPSTTFPFPERPANPMYGGYEVSQPTAMGPPGSHMAAADHNRKEAFLHAREAQFQDQRSAVTPCPNCGTYCNNQCSAAFQWEQRRRLHHGFPATMDAARYASPPNPYFNNGANPSAFPNMRHPLRHGTPPVNVPGNSAAIQLSPQFPGYRRPGDTKSPNVLPTKPELSPSHPHHGAGAAASSPHGPHPGNKYGGPLPANMGVNHRKSQSMSPLAALETMPMLATHSPNTSGEQRNRPLAQTVSSSDNRQGAPPTNATNKRLDIYQCTMQGGRLVKTVQAATPPTVNTGQQRLTEVAANKVSPQSFAVTHKTGQPVSASSQEAGRATASENIGTKRPAPQQTSEGGPPTKRSSPAVIIVDCDDGKPASSTSGGGGQGTPRATPPSSRSGGPPSTPVVISDSPESKKTPPHDGKQSANALTISSIRTSGIFTPPPTRSKKDIRNDPNPIIIIDDKDTEADVLQKTVTKTSKNEAQSSTPSSPAAKNPKAAGEPPPPAPIAPKTPSQGVQQSAAPIMVNKVQVSQPSPIIVTGTSSLTNQSLPVNVSGNQSIMLTFPVTMGSSGIVLAAPMNIAENQVSAVSPAGRMPVSKNPRFVQPNSVTSGNVNTKVGAVSMTSVGGQSNRITVSVPQTKPITVNVNQPPRVAGTLSINNGNLQKVSAVPAMAAGSQAVGQPIPLFVDANSRLILTGPTVASKDTVPSGIGNATVVTVNGGMVGGKLAFSNIAPVNVNGLGNTAFIAVDRPVGIGNSSAVTVAGNSTNFSSKAALNISNPTILTLNGGLSIGPQPVGAPIANIASVSAGTSVQVAPAGAPSSVGSQNNGIIIRKVGDPSGVPLNPPSSEEPPLLVVERLFSCSDCREKFSSLENLIAHQAVHKGQTAGGKATDSASKDTSDNDILPGGADDDAPKILYTTQGDDGSTVYVVTV